MVLAGHSFGGMTTIEVARVDPRVKISLTMDPWLFCRHKEIAQGDYGLTSPHFAISSEGFHPACEKWFDSLSTLKALQTNSSGGSPTDPAKGSHAPPSSFLQEHVIVRRTGHQD